MIEYFVAGLIFGVAVGVPFLMALARQLEHYRKANELLMDRLMARNLGELTVIRQEPDLPTGPTPLWVRDDTGLIESTTDAHGPA